MVFKIHFFVVAILQNAHARFARGDARGALRELQIGEARLSISQE